MATPTQTTAPTTNAPSAPAAPPATTQQSGKWSYSAFTFEGKIEFIVANILLGGIPVLVMNFHQWSDLTSTQQFLTMAWACICLPVGIIALYILLGITDTTGDGDRRKGGEQFESTSERAATIEVQPSAGPLPQSPRPQSPFANHLVQLIASQAQVVMQRGMGVAGGDRVTPAAVTIDASPGRPPLSSVVYYDTLSCRNMLAAGTANGRNGPIPPGHVGTTIHIVGAGENPGPTPTQQLARTATSRPTPTRQLARAATRMACTAMTEAVDRARAPNPDPYAGTMSSNTPWSNAILHPPNPNYPNVVKVNLNGQYLYIWATDDEDQATDDNGVRYRYSELILKPNVLLERILEERRARGDHQPPCFVHESQITQPDQQPQAASQPSPSSSSSSSSSSSGTNRQTGPSPRTTQTAGTTSRLRQQPLADGVPNMPVLPSEALNMFSAPGASAAGAARTAAYAQAAYYYRNVSVDQLRTELFTLRDGSMSTGRSIPETYFTESNLHARGATPSNHAPSSSSSSSTGQSQTTESRLAHNITAAAMATMGHVMSPSRNTLVRVAAAGENTHLPRSADPRDDDGDDDERLVPVNQGLRTVPTFQQMEQ